MDARVMTVTQVAAAASVEPHVVRYYSRIGLLKPKRHPENSYKLFSEADVKHLRFIRKAQQLGYTLSEIAEILRHAVDGESPCPTVREILQRRIEENRRRVEELLRLQQRMEQALEQWKDMPDAMPDGHTICALIESVDEH
jgi:MerR family Zn(II)-responsive transcriptional regulator of zntA